MTNSPGRIARLVLVATVSTVALAACATRPLGDGIGFREARFNEMSAIRDWQSCRDQAVRSVGGPASRGRSRSEPPHARRC